MEKISNFFRKLSKLPYILWFAVMAAASLLANLYSNVQDFSSTLDMLRDNGFGSGLAGAENTLFWFGVIIGSMLAVGIFELFLSIIYKYFARRGMVSRDEKYVKSVVRAFYAIANLLVALTTLLYTAVPGAYIYGTHIFNFLIYTGAYTLAFMILEHDSVNPKAVYTTFMRLYSIYFGIELIFGFFNMISGLTSKSIEADYKIAYIINFFLVIGVALALYFTLVKKYKEKQKNSLTITIINDNDNTPPPPDEIFKGFGF